jgi:hypothetical protein
MRLREREALVGECVVGLTQLGGHGMSEWINVAWYGNGRAGMRKSFATSLSTPEDAGDHGWIATRKG